MNCHRVEQLLSDDLEGLVSESDITAIEAHLSGCHVCCRRRDQLQAVRASLRQLAERLPVGHSDVYGRALHCWLAEQQAINKRRRPWFTLPFAAASPANDQGRGAREAGVAWGLSLAGAAAALLLAALLTARGHGRVMRTPFPVVTAIPHPLRNVPSAGPKPRAVQSSAANRITNSDVGSPGTSDQGRSIALASPEMGIRNRAPQHPSHAPKTPSQGLAVGDLTYLNRDPMEAIHPWGSLRPDEWEKIEARIHRSVKGTDDFITIPFPRLATLSNQQIARAVESYKREAAIVDPRLSHEVTCAFKATALSDICNQLRSDTSIQLAAGPSVADEKVTLLCEKMPLRDVMRQLSRPFGYTWLRSKKEGGEYRYELVQDLRSQLLEEELRNRDRNAALLDLDREMKQYQPYLNLSPDEALARAASAPPEERKLLEYLAGKGWGPAQLYSRLTPGDLTALRAGQKVSFSAAPGPGGQPLPPDLAHNVITSLRDYRIVRRGDSFDGAPAKYLPDGLPPASVPEAQPMVSLSLDRSELGQLTLHGYSGFYIGTLPNCLQLMGDDDRSLAVGMSPAVRSPQNAAANAKLAFGPALQGRVSIEEGLSAVGSRLSAKAGLPLPTADPPAPRVPGQPTARKVTTADVLEAIHRATGLPIVADYYTRLYPAAQVSGRNMPLFEALNRLADTMRLRWSKNGGAREAETWLQFRSADFYDDRLKEVPNRLLFRWAASRREHGALRLDDLIEISQLNDAQLDSSTMAEGARVLYGLEEWDLTRRSEMRSTWRFLARLSPEQRQSAQRASGLLFTGMSLAQQQEFLTLLPSQPEQLQSLQELSEASVQVDYSVPGEFQWRPTVPDASPVQRLQQSPRVRERTRQAALLAAQRIDPQVTEAQIAPTDFGLTLTYRLGGPKAHFTPFVMHADLHSVLASLPQPVAP